MQFWSKVGFYDVRYQNLWPIFAAARTNISEEIRFSNECYLYRGFYVPNFIEVEEAYEFGPVCYTLRFAYGQERLEIGSWNLIYGISMKNKLTHIFVFFSVRLILSLQSYVPFLTFAL